ncbi:MAG: PAS domain-containing protein [Leptospirales bacterium]|nr:PAS domain-containing protein [Leptospirales bacterium]HNN59563.1 PAS domain-containing protein [Leptospiraceae bacterium]HNN74101.1 PAS domain-containing protein [Leptospiraceae bacterium]
MERFRACQPTPGLQRKKIALCPLNVPLIEMAGKRTADEQHIAELERTLEAIRRKDRLMTESQSTVSRILLNAPVMIYVYDLVDKRNVYINREATDFLGYSSDQIRDLGPDLLSTLIHPEDLPRAIAHHNRLLGATGPLKLVYRMKNAKGEWRNFLSCDTPFETEPGEQTRFILGCVQEMPD